MNNHKNMRFKQTALVSALLLEISSGVQAATIAVDGTNCTLPDAITAANNDTFTNGCSAGSGNDILELNINASPIVLTNSLPIIATNMAINGNGSIIERDSNVLEFGIMEINNAAVVRLNEVTITGGLDSDGNFGTGIFVRNGASLELNDSIITGNQGGAVRFSGAAESHINNSVISYNIGSEGNFYNGGVSINAGILNINGSTITGNTNNAIYAGGGGLYITDFSGPATVNIINSTLSGNQATNSGGAIETYGFGPGINLTLINTTVTNNTTDASGGGIKSFDSNVTATQSLISGNTATVSAKTWIHSGTGTISVDYFNIFGEQSVSGLDGVTVGLLDIVPDEPATGILNPVLTNNGGPTPTHALVQGSRALDAVQEVNCAILTDQTGKARPIDGNADGFADCDIGAFESPNFDVIFKNGFD